MILKREIGLLSICLCLFFLFGCQQISNAERTEESLVDYEYLPLDNGYSAEVDNWLHDAKQSGDEIAHNYAAEDGIEYVYAKGYSQAKASYVYENIDKKINSKIKVTLLKGESSDELFIKVTYSKDIDVTELDVIEDEALFYN
ncbi:hypothetical protein NC661_03590 [Aquibacillus koreensis]|uniref:Uncharacterized protein n=1 Tax=Aquibacillus koreensis TaxID=279446 RepID=A0A9X3WJ12_9BACI|nr:hypothetical protein [Aquibacillus koreensis]MCT2536467.1 hypothetical protein [Aquibacillus koreensis]MDC3419445.1 hypothetical protein [Aquibacillus koreensis]